MSDHVYYGHRICPHLIDIKSTPCKHETKHNKWMFCPWTLPTSRYDVFESWWQSLYNYYSRKGFTMKKISWHRLYFTVVNLTGPLETFHALFCVNPVSICSPHVHVALETHDYWLVYFGGHLGFSLVCLTRRFFSCKRFPDLSYIET